MEELAGYLSSDSYNSFNSIPSLDTDNLIPTAAEALNKVALPLAVPVPVLHQNGLVLPATVIKRPSTTLADQAKVIYYHCFLNSPLTYIALFRYRSSFHSVSVKRNAAYSVYWRMLLKWVNTQMSSMLYRRTHIRTSSLACRRASLICSPSAVDSW